MADDERNIHNRNVFTIMVIGFFLSMIVFWGMIRFDFLTSVVVSLCVAGSTVTPVWKP